MKAGITCAELTARLAGGAVLIDVMTPEDYAACHAVGAHNACIYEMIFLDRITELVPDHSTELIVYDATGTTRAAETARERLFQAGYVNVSILAGGLAALCEAGLPVARSAENALVVPVLRDGVYHVDTVNSRVEWIGRNINNRHQGLITMQGGELTILGGKPVEGSLVADMTTIMNTDLADEGWRNMLIRHLMSDDFFSVERFPTASFRLTGWESIDGGAPEAPSGVAVGNLTIRDVTRPVCAQTILAPQPDGSVKAHAVLDIDRTLWNVCYGSGRLFERLGMHLVNELISLELFVVAR